MIKKIALLPIATKFKLQEVDGINQVQTTFHSPTVNMLYATMFWKLTKNGGWRGNEFVAALAIKKYFWRRISTKYVLHNEFKNFLHHKLVNKCKSRGKKRFITIACSSPWDYWGSFCYTCSSNSMKCFLVWVYIVKALLVFIDKVFQFIRVCLSLIYGGKHERPRP